MEFKKREITYGNYPEAETEMDLDDSLFSLFCNWISHGESISGESRPDLDTAKQEFLFEVKGRLDELVELVKEG